MIEKVTLRNFKRYGPQTQTLELGKITLLLGANSAGKSSVFQALLALRQSWAPDAGFPYLILDADSAPLGSFDNVVHAHDKTRPIEMGGDPKTDLISRT